MRSSIMESQKYGLAGSNDAVSTDGGSNAYLYEKGTNLALEPVDYASVSGLVGYWPLNEGTGTIAYDWSGNNATGSWIGTAAGTNGYYSPGKTEAWAGTTATTSADSYINLGTSNASLYGLTAFTVVAWVNPVASQLNNWAVIFGARNANTDVSFGISGPGGACNSVNQFSLGAGPGAINASCSNTILSGNTWYQIAAVVGPSALTNNVTLYINGAQDKIGQYVGWTWAPVGTNVDIGAQNGGGHPYTGLVSDVRLYNRQLSAAEISALYSAGR
jgi:hypothetical protein